MESTLATRIATKDLCAIFASKQASSHAHSTGAFCIFSFAVSQSWFHTTIGFIVDFAVDSEK